jgi:hypothetical protein
MQGSVVTAVRMWGLVGLLAGCASKSEGPERDHGIRASQSNAEVALEVENHGWTDVVIYLVRGTATDRIGTVGSLRTITFVLAYQKLGIGNDVRLRADPIGNLTPFTSENLQVHPGQWIKWTLENDLTRSFLAVY